MKINIDSSHTLQIDHWPETYPELIQLANHNLGSQIDYHYFNQQVANNTDLTIWERWMAYLIINSPSFVKIARRQHNYLVLYHLTDFLTFLVENPMKQVSSIPTVFDHKISWFKTYYYSQVDIDFIQTSGQDNNSDHHQLNKHDYQELQNRPLGAQMPRTTLDILHNLQQIKNSTDQALYADVKAKYQDDRQLFKYNRTLTKILLNQQYEYLHRNIQLWDNQQLQTYLEAHEAPVDPYRYDDDQQVLRQSIHAWLKTLSKKECYIIQAHTYTTHPQTFNQIAQHLNLSRERVRQIEAYSLRQIRYHLHHIYNYYGPFFSFFSHHHNPVANYYLSFQTDERQFTNQ